MKREKRDGKANRKFVERVIVVLSLLLVFGGMPLYADNSNQPTVVRGEFALDSIMLTFAATPLPIKRDTSTVYKKTVLDGEGVAKNSKKSLASWFYAPIFLFRDASLSGGINPNEEIYGDGPLGDESPPTSHVLGYPQLQMGPEHPPAAPSYDVMSDLEASIRESLVESANEVPDLKGDSGPTPSVQIGSVQDNPAVQVQLNDRSASAFGGAE